MMNKNFMDLEFPKGPFDSLFDMAVAYDRACSEC